MHPKLRLDYWALHETADQTFASGAMRHLDTTIRDFIRADGSTIEFIEYADNEDHIKREFTLLGVDDNSCWSRGQAWAIAGFLRGWAAFNQPRYLQAARACFGFWQQAVEDEVPPWDFSDPDGLRDTSASAIVIEQLARMAVSDEADKYREFTDHLEPMIDGLMPYINPTGRLVEGCFNRPRQFADNNELIWGSSYLLMALSYLQQGRVPC